MAEFTLDEHVNPNAGPDDYDSWFVTEMISAPGYNPATTYTLTGGSVTLSGPGAAEVTNVWDGVLQEETFAGTPGYGIHFVQPAGVDQFTIHCTLAYEIA